MHIEKLYSSKHRRSTWPGIVDIFLQDTQHIDKNVWGASRAVKHIPTYFNDIPRLLEDRGVHLGTNYGTKGITVEDFLSLTPDQLPADTVFELSSVTYSELSGMIKRKLQDRSDIIRLHDYMQVLYVTKTQDRNMRYASGEAFGVPMWLLCTVADTIEADCLADFYISDVPRLALCMVNKPRPWRLDMLEELYQQDLLDTDVDWTLCVSLPTLQKKYEIIQEWASRETHPFVQRFKDVLPKVMHADYYTECVYLPRRLVGNYCWNICCETYNHAHFVTEKTIKSFLGCMAPLTVAPAGFNKHLEAMGFQMPGDYDHLEGQERIKAIAQILKTDNTDYTDLIKHNYDLITNRTAISELIADRIVNEYS